MEIDLDQSSNEVQDPKLILNLIFLTKKQFEEKVDIFKGLLVENFYSIREHDEDNIDNQLVEYCNIPLWRTE